MNFLQHKLDALNSKENILINKWITHFSTPSITEVFIPNDVNTIEKEAFYTTKSIKAAIEQFEGWSNHFNIEDEGLLIIQSLVLLQEYFEVPSEFVPADRYAAYHLINKLVYQQLSETGQQIFDQKGEILFKWHNFFFSYTNTDKGDVKSDFSIFFRQYHTYQSKNKDEHHLASWLVDEHLHRAKPYFYDRKNLKISDRLEEEIQKACMSSGSFIQLIQECSFDEIKAMNWQHYEWEKFSNSIAQTTGLIPLNFRRYYFIILESPEEFKERGSSIKNVKYKEWHSQIGTSLILSLFRVSNDFHTKQNHSCKEDYESSNSTEYKQIRNQLKNISEQIIMHRKEIVDHILEN